MRATTFSERETDVKALLGRVSAQSCSELPLPRLLLVFAHPDDEVLAVGGRLERMAHARLLTVTDGAPLDGRDARDHGFQELGEYRDARQRELRAALAQAGLGKALVLPLAESVRDQTACFHLAKLARAVAEQIACFGPEAVLTHPYEGGHPDHDACAFAVHCAVRSIAETMRMKPPVILEAPFYHAGDDGAMRTGAFLPFTPETLSVTVELTQSESTRKRSRLACFVSQKATLAQFGTEKESFRVAPTYDFTAPPHAGQLLYERYQWGMTGRSFTELAGSALLELFPPSVQPT